MWTGAEAARRRGDKREESCVSGLGASGASSTRQVAELELLPAPVIPAHLTMAAARKVAELKSASVLLVERDGVLVGILDQHALVATPDDVRAGGALRPLDVCLGATTSLARARELFVRTGSAALPVAAGALLLGVVMRAALDHAVRNLARAPVEMGPPANGLRGRPAGDALGLAARPRHAA